MGEKFNRKESGFGKRGNVIPMIDGKDYSSFNERDILVENESLKRIRSYVANGLLWRINYFGVVKGHSLSDFSPDDLSLNCIDESYTNIFCYGDSGKNGIKNVDWYIFPPGENSQA